MRAVDIRLVLKPFEVPAAIAIVTSPGVSLAGTAIYPTIDFDSIPIAVLEEMCDDFKKAIMEKRATQVARAIMRHDSTY